MNSASGLCQWRPPYIMARRLLSCDNPFNLVFYLEYLAVSVADELLLCRTGLVHPQRHAVHQDHCHRQPLEPPAARMRVCTVRSFKMPAVFLSGLRIRMQIRVDSYSFERGLGVRVIKRTIKTSKIIYFITICTLFSAFRFLFRVN